MSATDHAFIRAFAERPAPDGPARPPHFDPTALTPTSVSVGNMQEAVSQYVTQPAALGAAALETIAARFREINDRVDAEPPPRTLPNVPGQAEPTERLPTMAEVRRHRYDTRQTDRRSEPHVDAHHFEGPRGGVAVTSDSQETTPGSQVPPGGLAATWEVDRFRWPDICTRLQSGAAARLTSVLRSVLHSAWRGQSVVAVTSFTRGEGDTTVALCLAQMAAACRVRAALVDGDWENPRIAAALGLDLEQGWEALSAKVGMSDVAIKSLEDDLFVLPLRPPARPQSTDLDQRAHEMLQTLSAAFELVILDAGPMFTASRRWFRPNMTPSVHTALVVRDVRNTDEHQVDDVCTRLSGAGIAGVAIVENFQQPSPDAPRANVLGPRTSPLPAV